MNKKQRKQIREILAKVGEERLAKHTINRLSESENIELVDYDKYLDKIEKILN